MLDNNITIPVDELNTDVTTDHTFSRENFYGDRSLYHGAGHSLITRDTLGFYRTAPKKSGNFNGVAKTSLKFTQDQLVSGVDSTTTIVAPAIITLSFSLPVGMTAADVLVLRQRVVALADDDVIMDALNNGLTV